MWMSVCRYIHFTASAQKDRGVGSHRAGSTGRVYHLTWLLGIELGPLEDQYMLLICEL